MKRKIITCLCALLAILLAVTGTVGYLTFLRPADHPPAELCAQGNRPDPRPRVVAAGASMTRGTLGADWVGRLRAQPEHPLDQYRDNPAAIVGYVTSRTTARIALMFLPPLGEDLDTPINRRLSGYNSAIKQLAHQAQVDYLPVHERMADHLRPRRERQPYTFGFPLALAVAAQHYLLRRSWDEIARGSGRELLIDHVHLSDRGGAILAGLASPWLSASPVRRSS